MTAKATMNTLSAGGTRGPNRARIPSAKAMSVAMGMPKPMTVGASALKK